MISIDTDIDNFKKLKFKNKKTLLYCLYTFNKFLKLQIKSKEYCQVHI